MCILASGAQNPFPEYKPAAKYDISSLAQFKLSVFKNSMGLSVWVNPHTPIDEYHTNLKVK